MNNLGDIRNEYSNKNLLKDDLNKNPYIVFKQWIDSAIKNKCNEPTATTLATVDQDNMPNCRIVLLKDIRDDGFVFFTNYNSTKGSELAKTNKAALNFFWPEMERQVRIRGIIEKVSSEMSDTYFQSRPRASQIGAWASNQSSIINDGSELSTNYTQLEEKYANKDIPRPKHWGGYIIKPIIIEFWQGKANRMHDRFQYQNINNNWIIQQLAP